MSNCLANGWIIAMGENAPPLQRLTATIIAQEKQPLVNKRKRPEKVFYPIFTICTLALELQNSKNHSWTRQFLIV